MKCKKKIKEKYYYVLKSHNIMKFTSLFIYIIKLYIVKLRFYELRIWNTWFWNNMGSIGSIMYYSKFNYIITMIKLKIIN